MKFVQLENVKFKPDANSTTTMAFNVDHILYIQWVVFDASYGAFEIAFTQGSPMIVFFDTKEEAITAYEAFMKSVCA